MEASCTELGSQVRQLWVANVRAFTVGLDGAGLTEGFDETVAGVVSGDPALPGEGAPAGVGAPAVAGAPAVGGAVDPGPDPLGEGEGEDGDAAAEVAGR